MTVNDQPEMNRTHQVARSTFIVIGGAALSFAVGLLRTRIVAGQFGTTFTFDAFSAVDGVSELIVTALAAGTLVFAFMPLYVEAAKDGGREEADKLASSVMNWLALLVGAIAIVVSLIAPVVVASRFGIGPGYAPQIQSLMIQLLRVSMLSMIIFSLSTLVTGILHSHQHFWFPALSPTAYSLGIIGGAILLTPTLGIFGLAWGAVAGACMHLLVQLPGLLQFGFRWTPTFRPGRKMRQVILLMLPRILDLILARGTLALLGANLNSFLGEGRQSAMTYAFRLMNIPWTLIGTAIGFAIFPVMAALAASNDLAAQRQSLSGGIRAVLVLALPSGMALLLFGPSLIQVLLEGAEFNAASANLVYYALQFYVVVLISQSVLDIVVRAFAAQKDTLTPLIVSVFTTGINVGLALWLTRPWAVGGLEHGGPPFANGIAVGVEATCGLVILHIRWRGIDAKRILTYGLKATLASVVMGGAIYVIKLSLEAYPLLFLIIGGIVATVVYIGTARLLGISEITTIPLMFSQRFQRTSTSGTQNGT